MSYPTSLTDTSWNFIEPFFKTKSSRGRKRKHPLKTVVDACLYIVDKRLS